MMQMSKLFYSGWALLFGVLTACSMGERTVNPPEVTEAPPTREYRIGPDDELYISVWKEEDLTRTVPVRPDGKISLPLVNDVQAAGRTPMELRNELQRRLASYLAQPEVSVTVVGIKSPKFSVVGEVAKPGVFEIRNRSTVLDAVALAEGFTPFANRKDIVVLRTEEAEPVRIPFNYEAAISPGGHSGNFPLRPGDVVVVP